MSHIIVSWNSQGFKLDNPNFASYINQIMIEEAPNYLTICLQEVGNLYTSFSKANGIFSCPTFPTNTDTAPSDRFNPVEENLSLLIGNKSYNDFKISYCYWTPSGANARCSMAVITNLPGVQFAYTQQWAAKDMELYRPVISAKSNTAWVHNIHAAATNKEAAAAGRPVSVFSALEENLNIGGSSVQQIVIGDYNYNVNELETENSNEDLQILKGFGGFKFYPPNKPTQGALEKKMTYSIRSYTSSLDFALVKGIAPNNKIGFVYSEMTDSDHAPIAYVFAKNSDTDVSEKMDLT